MSEFSKFKRVFIQRKNTVFIEDKSFPSGFVRRIPPFPLYFDNLYIKVPSVKIILLTFKGNKT